MACLSWSMNLGFAGSDSGTPPDTRRFLMLMGVGRGVALALVSRELVASLGRVCGLAVLAILLGG